ncbi:MAG: carbonate dehydratase [Verrucomicrobia bacterium]|nr:carbonate dehydratase [Verrucomicrobiota bacterium]
MQTLKTLFENNRKWAGESVARTPDFFTRLVNQQAPQYLWIGCSDSRVPANEIVGLLPGELFVHRNVANQVIHTDFNCLAVLQYAVDVLKVRHVIVCGHYDCGGVKAALETGSLGLIDNWLHPIRQMQEKHRRELSRVRSLQGRVDRLCEINVREQVQHVADTTIVREAWARKQPLAIHGWIYSVHNGRLMDMKLSLSSTADTGALHRRNRT